MPKFNVFNFSVLTKIEIKILIKSDTIGILKLVFK